jgi:glycerophosphoryl diester phosphodiesterase
VEIDVQLSSDGVPVVYHDAGLKRVSGVKGDLRKLPWERLRRLPAHEPGRFGGSFKKERIASLAMLAAAFARRGAGARLFVELKEESLLPNGRAEMLAAVHAALKPIRSRCVLISFDPEVLTMARAATRYPLGLVIRHWKDLKGPLFRKLKPDFVFSGTQMLPKSGSLKIRGSRHCVYEVPDPAVAAGLWRRGAEMIETFALDHYL